MGDVGADEGDVCVCVGVCECVLVMWLLDVLACGGEGVGALLVAMCWCCGGRWVTGV